MTEPRSEFERPPPSACWRHQGLRSGFEVAYFLPDGDGWLVDGTTAGLQDGNTWVVTYRIRLDRVWTTRSAEVVARTKSGSHACRLDSDRAGCWKVDGKKASRLDGCLDVDLESSAVTNAFPVHRLGLAVGDRAPAPATYVRAEGLGVEKLDQLYRRVEDLPSGQQYDYEAPGFEFRTRLSYDTSGLVIDYPGIATRAG